MAGRGSGPDFVEALARGLDVVRSLGTASRPMSLSEVAEATGLARPTARRLLLTLTELGYVRTDGPTFALTTRVLELGTAYVSSLGLWDIARPHLEALVARTGESSSMAQLDGSDIVYVARVAVPKIIALRVEIGTLFPAPQTSQGKVLLAALAPDELERVLDLPSRAGLPPYIGRTPERLREELVEVRARGWALADEELAPGVRSVACPVRDGEGVVRAAMNVTVHAAETPTDRLLGDHLPLLLRTAGDVSAEWALWQSRPHVEVTPAVDRAAGAD
ncbi:IclR family transcriptional regulator C-terminal domain-containing protein [Nocardioides sp. CFH 31398]|uniref:IclR family transcriptional regulator domain-containing protein n=1 Tax=Nocardioides sp. CFH 31398 TaxID=2919579 RepID=UPI001F05DE0E|nr:IclR family transcriptional regulator C-terminal domain-containing protein [Nocardioides sp. CFH 31398]MCH1868641.1 helix-turn-helix domain-containing protein [Nocardioides sp. CFH 31398]